MIITDNTFNEVINDNDLVLVDFWADWCGPCKMLSPILDEIADERGLLVGKLNVDENPIKSEEYSVTSIPYMVLFKSGRPVKKITGAKPKHILLEELAEWI